MKPINSNYKLIPIRGGGFAMVTLIFVMLLITLVAVSYLTLSRAWLREQSVTEAMHQSEFFAEAGFAEAVDVLRRHSQFGNYVTAERLYSDTQGGATTSALFTQMFRPGTPATAAQGYLMNEYKLDKDGNQVLALGNYVGDYLLSRSNKIANINTIPFSDLLKREDGKRSFDLRTNAFALPLMFEGEELQELPNRALWGPLSAYDFNRPYAKDKGHLVYPQIGPTGDENNPYPAWGEWIYVRDQNGRVKGRYAFYIEDESMKLPIADISPTFVESRVSEGVNASVVFEGDVKRAQALVAAQGLEENKSAITASSLAHLDAPWSNQLQDWRNFVSTVSETSDTTAGGWMRLNLNELVAEAEDIGTPDAKVEAANLMNDWIVEAWTGSEEVLDPGAENLDGSLLEVTDPDDSTKKIEVQTRLDADSKKIFSDVRLRSQLTANIVDFIDGDSQPTVIENMTSIQGGLPDPVPVIGIEQIPYLSGIALQYEAEHEPGLDLSILDDPDAQGGTGSSPELWSGELRLRIRFKFHNVYDEDLELNDIVRSIRITGIPALEREGEDAAEPVYSYNPEDFITEDEWKKEQNASPMNVEFEVDSELGMNLLVPAAVDGQTDQLGRGAVIFDSSIVKTWSMSDYKLLDAQSQFVAAEPMVVELLGIDQQVIDVAVFEMSGSQVAVSYINPINSADRKELVDADDSVQVAGLMYETRTVLAGNNHFFDNHGDPRFRPGLMEERFLVDLDTTTEIDLAKFDLGTFSRPATTGIDWHEVNAFAPIARFNNSPLEHIGELGMVTTSSHPYRTLYFDDKARSSEVDSVEIKAFIEAVRSTSVDEVLLDLFTVNTQSSLRNFNINSNRARYEFDPGQPNTGNIGYGCIEGVFARYWEDPFAGVVPLFEEQANLLASEFERLAIFNRKPYWQRGDWSSDLALLVRPSPMSVLAGKEIEKSIYDQPEGNASGLLARTGNQLERPLTEIADYITNRGDVFRVLSVGQVIQDLNSNDRIEFNEVVAEYIQEAYVQRVGEFEPILGGVSEQTVDSSYEVLSKRAILD